MTILRLPILTTLCVCLSVGGCDSDNEEVTATASESGETASTGDMTTSGGSSDTTASIVLSTGVRLRLRVVASPSTRCT